MSDPGMLQPTRTSVHQQLKHIGASFFRPHLTCRRPYALSRFPQREPGVSRTHRQRRPRPLNPPTDPANGPHEDIPSAVPSQLWQTSQRPPVSDPERGLKTLLLENETLVIERQLEMLNIFVGFEQSNKYSISNEHGQTVGYIAEEPKGFIALLARQAFATHRPFRAVIMDLEGSPVMWVRRPFAWINSRMFVQRLKEFSQYTAEEEPILDTFAEVQQVWHPWRRRYNLFIRKSDERILSTASEAQPQPDPVTFSQFAAVDSGFLAWHFRLLDGHKEEIAYISRAFRGFGREIFTDTGQYSIRFGPREAISEENSYPGDVGSAQLVRNLTLDERALTLALAVNIDFDYFSRHSGPGSGGLIGMSNWD